MQGLSLRLSTIAELIPEGAGVCDVGTDHGFLPIFLKKRGNVKNVIATDINIKPLKKAEENIKNAGVEGIELRLCDGLSGVNPQECDTVIVAGIGGEVISGILSRGGDFVNRENITLILQPTTSPEVLRKYLFDNGFVISKEIPLEENDKLYSVMQCHFTGKGENKPWWFYFSGMIDPKNPIGNKYLKKQQNRAFKCMTALKDIKGKEEEYLYYKEIFDNLWRLTADT